MRVSVIVPCYNAGAYLEPCLRSVLAQTMGDLELLVIDDGSTDGSLSVVQEIARGDARVRVYHVELLGCDQLFQRGTAAEHRKRVFRVQRQRDVADAGGFQHVGIASAC